MRAIKGTGRGIIGWYGGLATTLLLLISACAPPPPGDPSDPASQEIPELTKEVIDERINDARVFEVMPESGKGEPIAWGFDWDEPKEVTVVDKQIDGTHASIVLDIRTQSAPRSHILRQLAGQIRTDWELKTGWVVRRWEIVNTENISMKYKDLPKPEPGGNTKRPPEVPRPDGP